MLQKTPMFGIFGWYFAKFCHCFLSILSSTHTTVVYPGLVQSGLQVHTPQPVWVSWGLAGMGNRLVSSGSKEISDIRIRRPLPSFGLNEAPRGMTYRCAALAFESATFY